MIIGGQLQKPARSKGKMLNQQQLRHLAVGQVLSCLLQLSAANLFSPLLRAGFCMVIPDKAILDGKAVLVRNLDSFFISQYMRPQDIISRKRDGAALSAGEIGLFIRGVCEGTWADYQIAALVMAMFIRGLDDAEQQFLTEAMLNSGDKLDFSEIAAPKADKHSTGGVGDKTSLIIAPVAAACGLAVPMISGRALGHTGGTLDKLESIPGYNVNLSTAEIKDVLKKCGFAMAGQTAEVAPADKKLYALRDATATVPCIPLIVASIMSKKLAEDLDVLILDVKTGSGAFMQKFDDAKRLAAALVKTGSSFGVRTQAVVSDMSQPLGKFVGNAVEVYECLKILRGETDVLMQPTLDLSVELTARMLVLAGIAASIDVAKSNIDGVLDSGAALEKFRHNTELQGGDPRVCDDPESLLDNDLVEIRIETETAGFISEIDTLAIGEAICDIGGGRIKADDPIDRAIGFCGAAKIGDAVAKGQLLGILHCRSHAQADFVSPKLLNSYKIDDTAPSHSTLIGEIVE